MANSNIDNSDELINKFNIQSIKRIHESELNENFWMSPFYETSKPLIIHGFDKEEFGGCIDNWNTSFFMKNMGETEISIHTCKEPTLLFSPKNFSYKKLLFKDFIIALKNNLFGSKNLDYLNDQSSTIQNFEDENDNNLYLYFRSISSKPTKKPANFYEDLPKEISDTFCLPKKIQFNQFSEQFSYHSSVLRIAQPGLQLWTHYDTPDNFLIQVIGEKRVFMFPPDQVMNLYITDSSSAAKSISVNPDFEKFPYLQEALKNAQWGELVPGDILFIPSCWAHCIWMKPLELNKLFIDQQKINIEKDIFCLSINFFFQNSQRNSISEGKDIYGNKDYRPAQLAINKLETSLIPEIKKLPKPFSKFYLLKMASILLKHSQSISSE